MKKILLFSLFALLSTMGFSQLKVTVVHDGQVMHVQFPSGQSIEYVVSQVDPINPGKLELQKGVLGAPAMATEVHWSADLKYLYEVAYRYNLTSGELSQWFTFDPKLLLTAEEK